MTSLSAAPPIEPLHHDVGHATVRLRDAARADRELVTDVWYPAVAAGEPMTRYELLPGIAFDAASARQRPAVAEGSFPVAVLSHGRTGMRFNYSLLCEALASRGYVVVSCDHPGDGLNDWLTGAFVDDRTNEVGRVADARLLLDSLGVIPVGPREAPVPVPVPAWPDGLVDRLDHSRVAAIGHSYGAYTGLAAVAGSRGVEPDERFRAVVGLQAYTRTMSDTLLARVHTPTMFVVSELDQTTPAATDGDRPWGLVDAQPTWRLDLAGSAHHASSDMGLYLELAAQLSDLPALVVGYIAMMSSEMTGPQFRPWRERLLLQVRAVSAFFDIVLGIDPARGAAEAEALAVTDGLQLHRR